MEALDQILYDRLMATPAVTTIVSDRISLEQLPQDDDLPAITFESSGLSETPGTAPIHACRVRVNCWSHVQSQAASLARAADGALHEYHARSGDVWLKYLERVDRDRFYDDELDVWGMSYAYQAIVIFSS